MPVETHGKPLLDPLLRSNHESEDALVCVRVAAFRHDFNFLVHLLLRYRHSLQGAL